VEARTYPEFSTRYPLLLTTFMKRPVKLYPDETGIVYRNPTTGAYSRFTWSEWYERTCRLANVLQGPLAVRPGGPDEPGDRIATMALNHHRHMELYYAVPCSGAVLHPINVRLSPAHIIHTINHSQDKVIFVDDVILPLLESIYDDIKDTVEAFVYLSDKPGLPETRIAPIYEYEALLDAQTPEFEWPALHEDTCATLCYTTGTTGLPKGAMFTHRQLYLHTVHVMLNASMSTDPARVSLGEAVVPTILAMIIEFEDLARYDLSSLRSLGVGGGALPLGLKRKAEKAIPGFSATSGYGMTETAPVVITAFAKKFMADWSQEQLDEIRVKTGLPVPGIEVEVVDEQMNPVPRDNETVGEIVLRGPWITGQYYKEPEKTAEVWRDGWFHTGDAAKVDAEGYITIADRIKDVIRSGAEMVPTVLLENLTATADFVLEATYVGVPDEKWGERPVAILTLVPGATESEDDVMRYLETEGVEKGRITRWMLPDYVLITDQIPKTSVGKFDKIAIRKNLGELLPKAKRTKGD
jgi:acyl-CoA synthetase (AMP-forming)/AMP-acid ligase II